MQTMCAAEELVTCEPISSDGFEILDSVSQAPRFNRWMIDKLRPYLGKQVLEAGCGIGNLTAELTDVERLVAVDMDGSYVAKLQRQYADRENVSFYQTDLHDLGQVRELAGVEFDTVLCVNVLEHVRDDRLVLEHFAKLLKPGGRLVLLVPAHPWLYSEVDRTLGHFRRYTRADLRRKIEEAGLTLDQLSGFNRLGTLGWFVSGKFLQARTLTAGQMRTYERLLPFAKVMERVALFPTLSLIAIGNKAS